MKIRLLIIYLLGLIIYSCNGIEDVIVSKEDIISLKIYDFEGIEEIDEPLIGDGEIIVTLKAKIPANAKSDSRTVKFKASDGAIFVGVGRNEATDVVNNEGIAQKKLKLPLDDKPVSLSAEVTSGGNTYTSEATVNLIGVDEIITLELLDVDGNRISEPKRADGFTLIKLKATVNYNQDVFNQVTFEKSIGEFQSVSGDKAIKNIDDSNIAILDLQLPSVVERIYLSAKVGSSAFYFDEEELDVLRAYPNKLIVEPDNVNMAVNETNTIKVFFKREFGHVSEGTEATFESFQIVSGEEVKVGRFTGLETAKTNAEGSITTVKFKTDTGDFDVSLPVIIRVSSQNDSGDLIQSSISINLN